jgi:hypothetical protein
MEGVAREGGASHSRGRCQSTGCARVLASSDRGEHSICGTRESKPLSCQGGEGAYKMVRQAILSVGLSYRHSGNDLELAGKDARKPGGRHTTRIM